MAWRSVVEVPGTNATAAMRSPGDSAGAAPPPPLIQLAGTAVFVLVWVLILRDRWSWLPLGRAASTLLGGSLMVGLGVLSPAAAVQSVNLPTLTLLFACMLIGAHMEAQGLYAALSAALDSPTATPTSMLLRVSLVSALASALLTNDTVCVILTPIVVRSCVLRARPLNPVPYAVAIATAANIGSACSPIGNPQNMLIAMFGGVYATQFLSTILLASAGGVAINTAIILFVYRADLGEGRAYAVTDAQRAALGVGVGVGGVAPPSGVKRDPLSGEPPASPAMFAGGRGSSTDARASILVPDEEHDRPPCAAEEWPVPGVEAGGDGAGGAAGTTPAPRPLQPATRGDARRSTRTPGEGGAHVPLPGWRRGAIRALLALLPLLLLIADRWVGLGWVACLAAALMTALHGKPPEELLGKVDALLLLFFSGLFVVVEGFNATGLPRAAWQAVSGYVGVTTTAGLVGFSALVLVGSNTVSNVPLVLLLADKVQGMGPHAPTVWLLLAWTSTVAGNLTLIGSVANLIVAERCKDVAPLTFGEYTRVGAPSTLLLTLLGVPLVAACAARTATT